MYGALVGFPFLSYLLATCANFKIRSCSNDYVESFNERRRHAIHHISTMIRTGRHFIISLICSVADFLAGAFYSFDWALFLGTVEHQGFLFLSL